jgi:hypothetical protein
MFSPNRLPTILFILFIHVYSDAALSDTRPRQRIKPSTMCDWVKLVPPDRELFPQVADQTELK